MLLLILLRTISHSLLRSEADGFSTGRKNSSDKKTEIRNFVYLC